MEPEEPRFLFEHWYRESDTDDWRLVMSYFEPTIRYVNMLATDWLDEEHHQVRIQRL